MKWKTDQSKMTGWCFFCERLTRISRCHAMVTWRTKLEIQRGETGFWIYIAAILWGSASAGTIMCYVEKGRQSGWVTAWRDPQRLPGKLSCTTCWWKINPWHAVIRLRVLFIHCIVHQSEVPAYFFFKSQNAKWKMLYVVQTSTVCPVF